MSAWNRSGPVMVEVDGSAENLRIVDYAAAEALRAGSKLVLVAPYSAHTSYTPMMPVSAPASPRELADAALRAAVAHVRRRNGYATELAATAEAGPRPRVLAHAARKARMLVVGRSRSRGPERLVHTHGNLTLAARAGCPVVVVPLAWRPSPLDRKVAVGIDGTALPAEALEFAFGEVAGREGELTVVHAADPSSGEDPECSLISRAEYALLEELTPWMSRFPDVKVSRHLSSRPSAAALVQESGRVGLVVVGVRSGALPVDPVARRSLAAMTCPIAIVPHHLTDHERLQIVRRRNAAVRTH